VLDWNYLWYFCVRSRCLAAWFLDCNMKRNVKFVQYSSKIANFDNKIHFTTESRARSQVSPYEICDGRWWYSDRVFSEYVGFALWLSFHQWSTLIFIYTYLFHKGQTGEVWEPLKKRCSFRLRLALNTKVLALLRNK